MKNASATILYNKPLTSGYYKLGLGWKNKGVRPGHFVMLRVSGGSDPLLRRALGVYDVLRRGQGIELIYKVVGKGTTILSNMEKGECLDVLGPLGNGFKKLKTPEKLIMVAGGVGLAPFFMLAKEHAKHGAKFLMGLRTKAEAKILGDIKATGIKVLCSTDDGTLGTRGFVTDLLKKEVKKDSIVYACGPMGMLKSVAMVAKEAGACCYVSLEGAMACGIGVCLGCAVKTYGASHKPGDTTYNMVCTDGPVFNSEDILWDELG